MAFSFPSFLNRLPTKARPLVETALFGIVASLAAVGFQLAIGWLYQRCYLQLSEGDFATFAWRSLAVIVVTSLVSGWLLHRFCPEAAGSGIPQVKLGYWKEFGHAPRRIAWVKLLAGFLTIGGGQSLGREGPTVQIGSNLAASLAGFLGIAKQKRRTASATGAAAGLAAAFNAPLAAVAFVLEEIIGDLNSRALGAVLFAAVIGAFIVHALIGPQPAFELPQMAEPTWRSYLLMPVGAALAALVGVGFQRLALGLRARSRRWQRWPKWLQPLAGGLITWGIGLAVFRATGKLGIFSLGYEDLSTTLVGGTAWGLALVLLLGKLVATVASYGFGGCGGIFSPNLFFGAMCGAIVAGLGGHVLQLNEADRLLLTIGGMSACLGAVVQAPVTAILIIFEMTHQFAVVPGLMLAGLVSQGLSRALHHHNFYEEVLQQDGHQMAHLVPPRDLESWQGLPVSAIANFSVVFAPDLRSADASAWRKLLDAHPYHRFPVSEDGVPAGLVERREIERALAEGRGPRSEHAFTSRPSESVRAVQAQLIESPMGAVLLAEQPSDKPFGLITLHDLLRAQIARSERA